MRIKKAVLIKTELIKKQNLELKNQYKMKCD